MHVIGVVVGLVIGVVNGVVAFGNGVCDRLAFTPWYDTTQTTHDRKHCMRGVTERRMVYVGLECMLVAAKVDDKLVVAFSDLVEALNTDVRAPGLDQVDHGLGLRQG